MTLVFSCLLACTVSLFPDRSRYSDTLPFPDGGLRDWLYRMRAQYPSPPSAFRCTRCQSRKEDDGYNYCTSCRLKIRIYTRRYRRKKATRGKPTPFR